MKYITRQGDTWDLIEANLKYSASVIFPANIELEVPEVEIPVSKTLPPWLR